MLKHQEQLHAELHFKLLEEKEKFTVREQDNSMLESLMKELSGEVERSRKLHLERVVTCVSGTSKDKNASQRFVGEDNSQILTETQQEFKTDLPTDHEITDATENAGNMWKSLQECGNTEFDDATQEEYQKIPSSGDTSGVEVAKLEHPKNQRQKTSLEKKAWSSAQRWLANKVEPWTTWTSPQPRATMLTKSSTSRTKIGTTTGTLWMWLQMRYSQQLHLKETRSMT